MKASELISALREQMQVAGDREVRFSNGDPTKTVAIGDVEVSTPTQTEKKKGHVKAYILTAEEE